MTLQLGVLSRNAYLDAIETLIGVTPILDIRAGAPPANCAAADAGTELVHMTLPNDWLSAAAAGIKSKLGTWSNVGLAAGSAGHFRIKEATDTTCEMQGTITAVGGGGDMELDNVSIALNQSVSVSIFTLTAGNP